MAPDRLDETNLAEAWVSGDGTPRDRSGCPDEDRFWQAARGGLGKAAVASLLEHTHTCPDCALALKTACELHAAATPLPDRPPAPSFWETLRATLLRPEASLAYLLLLAASFPVYRALTPAVSSVASPVSAVASAKIVGLESETVTRGGASPLPAAIAPVGGETVVLRLFIERDELAEGESLHVTVAAGERVLYDRARGADTLGDQGTLDLMIDTAAIPTGQTVTIIVTSGAAQVFRRSVLIRP
jgi:hypothetical protein